MKSAFQSNLTLLAKQEGMIEQEVFLQHGITICRATSKMICIEDCEVEHSHLRPTTGTRQKQLIPAPRWTYKEANAPPSGATSSTNSLTAYGPWSAPREQRQESLLPSYSHLRCPQMARRPISVWWPHNGALRPPEGPPALQSSRLSAPPSSSADSCFPGHPTHFTKHPLTTHWHLELQIQKVLL